MKRILSLILAGVIILSSSAVAFAADSIASFIPVVDEYYEGVQDYIAKALRGYKSEINISDFSVSTTNIMPVFRSAVFSNPDIFFVDAAYIDYTYDLSTKKIETITPKYIYTRSRLPAYVKKLNRKINSYLSEIDDSWSDYQKALYLHDKLIVNSAYKKENSKSYTSYNILINGKGVCEGYSKAYSLLLSKLGIENKIIDNSEKRHCWNLVKLDGKWYHTDVTSDDLLPDCAGFVSHKYFLCSDPRINSLKLNQQLGFKSDVTYDSDYKCSSTKYDDAFFRNVNSEIIYKGGALYYLSSSGHTSNFIKYKNGSKKVLKTFKDIWYGTGGDAFASSYARLCEHDGFIYISAKRCIYRYKLSTGKISRVFTAPKFWDNDFYGIKYSGGFIKTVLKKAPTQTGSMRKILSVSSTNRIVQLPFLRYSSLSLNKGYKTTLTVYKGSGSTKFKSSNSKVAKVSSKSVIKALKKGTATITATKNGIKLSCKVKVI